MRRRQQGRWRKKGIEINIDHEEERGSEFGRDRDRKRQVKRD